MSTYLVFGLIFKEEQGYFTQHPGGFYNNISFKEEEGAHFQGGRGPCILIAFLEVVI